MATLSVLGLYEYDNTLFSLFAPPEGIDVETAINDILAECADMEVLYPSWEVMHTLIGVWSKKCEYKWKTLLATTMQDYDPIANYDRHEQWDEHGDHDRTTNGTVDGNYSDTSKATLNSTVSENTGVHGFNDSTTAQPWEDKTTTTATTQDTTDSGKNSSLNVVSDNGVTNNTRIGRAWGNIGVTTTQTMLQQEREISDFSIYDAITNDFKQRFCLLVY